MTGEGENFIVKIGEDACHLWEATVEYSTAGSDENVSAAFHSGIALNESLLSE